MIVNVRGYITSKDAEAYKDCADHYACILQLRRFAIADGVSKSFFPKLWSKILVDKAVEQTCDEDGALEDCRKEWLSQVTRRVSRPEVKWFTANAFLRQEPALSTLVTLAFDEENMCWTASAIGDSFLFFVPRGREDDMEHWTKLSSKPEPVVFDNFPDYLSSRGGGKGEARHTAGLIEPGTFYLMTDALSEWVFENRGDALRLIQTDWTGQNGFRDSVNRLRHSGVLHDDDSSVLIINVEDDGIGDICYGKVDVSSLEDLVGMEETLQHCKDTVALRKAELWKDIEEIIDNANLSEYAKREIKDQLSKDDALAN